MSETLVLFLPDRESPIRWLRITDAAVSARGEGIPASATDDEAPPVVIAPAEAVTLHWATLPDRSLAQSVAAARLLVADASASSLADLHVAVGREDTLDERPIGVVSAGRMRAWLDALAVDGVDPRAIIPAPMVLPRPADGYVRADLGGGVVVRGPTSGFGDGAGFTEMITGGVTPTVLDRDEIEAAIVAAVAAPALDLRQGAFARRTRRSIDWALVRRLARLAVAIMVVTLAILLIEIVKLNMAAGAMETKADMLARAGLPRGETVNDADRQLTERLGRLRGSGIGFGATAATVYAAVRAVPGVEVRGLSFDGNGKLRVTIAAQGEGQVTDVRTRLTQQGFSVQQSPLSLSAGIVSGDLTVSS